jgi:DNA-binding NtrC family response regulator
MDRAALQERFGIIGTAPGLLQALDRVRQVARTGITVLIQGESGVGKELFAQALHELSTRRHKSLVSVNCGAIPEGLIESELFGNEKGAYTGAVERRTGYFEEANGGTIFLDEIGEMPLSAQVRLLRVLETGTFSRIGSSQVHKTDVRVIAATNKDLAREVQAGRFREDLYYRLSTVILHIPPLRERQQDILPLFDRFLHRFSQQYNIPPKRLDERARRLLTAYRWPGNIRELRNVAEQTVVLSRAEQVMVDDLQPYLRGVTAAGVGEGLVPLGRHDDRPEARERELIYRALLEMRLELRELKEQISALVAHLGTSPARPVPLGEHERRDFVIVRDGKEPDAFAPVFIEEAPYEIEPEERTALVPLASHPAPLPGEPSRPVPTLEDVERNLIVETLQRFEGNRRQTARALGISERTLYRKLKELEAAA